MDTAAANVLLNYGALGVMSLGGIYMVYYFLKEVRAVLIEIHSIVKDIKEIQSIRVQETIAHERERGEQCFKTVVVKLDTHHQEILDEIRTLRHVQEKCQECRR